MKLYFKPHSRNFLQKGYGAPGDIFLPSILQPKRSRYLQQEHGRTGVGS